MKSVFNNIDEQSSLLHHWLALWQRLGIENDSLVAAGKFIIAAYEGKDRYYHTQKHLDSVLTELAWAKDALEKSGELEGLSASEKQSLFDTVELALWYHDVVYNAQAHDNETQSRDLFLADARKFGLAGTIQKDVAHLIDLTANHKKAETLTERLMTDCDLAILGSSPATFRFYDYNISKEYAHIPSAEYKAARLNVLKGFLDQPQIFKTAAFRQKLEAQARKNLTSIIIAFQPKPQLGI